MRVATIALVLLISIASGGCVFERKPDWLPAKGATPRA